MAALHPAPTRRASPDLHPEPRRRWRRERREIGLELIGVAFVHDTPATMRATRRQRCVERAVRIRWWESMPVTAMQPVALAARRLRVDRRVTLTERGRLPFPRPPRLLQQPLQLHDPHVTGHELSVTNGQRLSQTSNGHLQLGHNRLEIPGRIRTPARPNADPLSKDAGSGSPPLSPRSLPPANLTSPIRRSPGCDQPSTAEQQGLSGRVGERGDGFGEFAGVGEDRRGERGGGGVVAPGGMFVEEKVGVVEDR